MKEQRGNLAQEFKDESKGNEFLLGIITGDEWWVHHCGHENKKQRMEFPHLGSPALRHGKQFLREGRGSKE